ncbi:MAG TPA: tyrosine-type recombinase/integrase [Thermoanaerobaculia bacterium]|nr:tyrosine-type recombinase/integrase [Thermoanaerobaculia bacterium]
MNQPHDERHPAPDGLECPTAPTQECARSLTADDERFLDEFARKFADFLDHARYTLNHSLATCRGYKAGYQNLRHFLVAGAGTVELRTRMYAIEAWVAWNRKRGLSAISTNTYWRATQVFYRYLEQRDGIQNPFRGMKKPARPTPLPKARTPDECRRILTTAANYPWKTEYQRARAVALFGLLIFAGLRRAEVTRLLYADVNFEAGTIRITRGKGRNGGKDRTAYMNDDLRRVLREYTHQRARMGYTCPEFFVSLKSGQGLSMDQFIRIFRDVRRASGLKFSIHSLRHSFVTMLLQSGIPIHVAKELAGHADINTTAGYLRVWDDEERDQVRKLRL